MPDSEDQPQRPAQFAAALDAIRHATPRAELIVTEISAPGNLAPYSVALSADVTPVRHGSDSDFGTGRFILLYDPDEPESWGGPFRVVCFAQAPLETDIGVDPFLAEVAWAWLVDALDARGARYTAASGTATKILSSGFGELAHQGDGAQIELRASWSPLDNDLGAHVEGWGELLCMLAGLPPTTDVPTLPRRNHPAGSHHGGTHAAGAHEAGTHQTGTHQPGAHQTDSHHAVTEPHDARHDEASGTGGISVGPLDSIGPSVTSMRRSGSGLPTLGVTATGPDSGGMETVGVDTAGPDPLGTPGAGRETVRMNAVGMHAVDSNAVGINTEGLGTVGLKAVGLKPVGLSSAAAGSDGLDSVGLSIAGSPAGAPTMAVADLSARRAARG